MNQHIINTTDLPKTVCDIVNSLSCRKVLLVCKHKFAFISNKSFSFDFVIFNEFSNNPKYQEVCNGVKVFNDNNCDCVLAIGGGSTIDVAKCIKLYCKMDSGVNYLEQECFDTHIPLIAVPSTAGTGSESTRFSVIYLNGVKQSVHHNSIVPDYAILDSSLLLELPLFQKKCTLLDALCQAIESWWSVNSTDESIVYSKESIKLILENYREYLNNSKDACEKMMIASNLAGRAINITQTTAAHAMSYKITSLYGFPHGYAVAVCLAEIWEYMTSDNSLNINGFRSMSELNAIFDDIANVFNCKNSDDAVLLFRNMLNEMELDNPISSNRKEDIELLVKSVNPDRLKNNPVSLSKSELRFLYERIIK